MEPIGSAGIERLLTALLELRALPAQGRGREELLEALVLSSTHLTGAPSALLAWPQGRGLRLLVDRRGGGRWEEDQPMLSQPLLALQRWLDGNQGAALPEPIHELLRRRLEYAAGSAGNPNLVAVALRSQAGAFLLATLSDAHDAPMLLQWLGRAALGSLDDLNWIEALRRDAETDELTDVGNYRLLMRGLMHWMAERRPFALLMIDTDNLKEYNARYGHLGGSGALREIAQILRDTVQPADLVTKYGGDEFAVMLLGAERGTAEAMATRICDRVREHAFERDPERRLTVSIGIAVAPDDGQSPTELLRSADRRLFDAKNEGRDRSVAAEPMLSWVREDR